MSRGGSGVDMSTPCSGVDWTVDPANNTDMTGSDDVSRGGGVWIAV